MNKFDLEPIIEANLSILDHENYKVTCEIEGSGIFITVFRENESSFLKISQSFLKNYDTGLKLNIKIIENIIGPILSKAGIKGSYESYYAYTTNLFSIDKQNYEATKISTEHVKTVEDVIAVLHQLNDYIENVAEPFFEKWSDLRVLNDFIETIPQRQITKYLGMSATFKKILIFKLCNNPKYKDEFERVYNKFTKRYQENPNGDRSYKQWNDAVILLKEALDKVEPIYNV